VKKVFENINHAGDCSIYVYNCDICDCGELRKLMPYVDEVNETLRASLMKHQMQVRKLVKC